MNTIVTSREAILEVSRNLIQTQGWTAINIRTVASHCGVAVGSIYNYFGSKSDLVAATIESVWCDIFHFSNQETFPTFLSCVEWIYECMEKGEEKYPHFFTLHSMSFLEEEKSKGQQLMKQAWEHIKHSLYIVLLQDKTVRSNAFGEDFSEHQFVDLVFSLILSALLQHNYDNSVVLEMIKRCIY